MAKKYSSPAKLRVLKPSNGYEFGVINDDIVITAKLPFVPYEWDAKANTDPLAEFANLPSDDNFNWSLLEYANKYGFWYHVSIDEAFTVMPEPLRSWRYLHKQINDILDEWASTMKDNNTIDQTKISSINNCKNAVRKKVNFELKNYPFTITIKTHIKKIASLSYQVQHETLRGLLWFEVSQILTGKRNLKRCPLCNNWEDMTSHKKDWTGHRKCNDSAKHKKYQENKDAPIAEMHNRGCSVEEIAATLGIEKRKVKYAIGIYGKKDEFDFLHNRLRQE